MPLPRLTVSGNRRFVIEESGRPFFWLGDTAWELFHRLTREEIDLYLVDRAAKGFNVVQAVALAELDGIRTPNPYGETPLIDADPTRLNDGYFQHVDYGLDRAGEHGLYIALLPTWGDKVQSRHNGAGPVIFTPANAYTYGRLLAQRYRDRTNIVWVLGGDRLDVVDDHDVTPIWRSMAQGIVSAYDRKPLMTYHPRGDNGSSLYYHHDDWLDLNMWQSGHSHKETPVWEWIEADTQRIPPKPTFDGEPSYEDHAIGWNTDNGFFRDDHVRRACYRSVFAGGFGVTYGHASIWQMWQEGREPMSPMERDWKAALNRPAAAQMIHLKRLMLSRPYLSRIPDQGIISRSAGEGEYHIRATRDEHGRYAMVYIPTPQTVGIHTDALSGAQLKAWWYDPRTGAASEIETFPAGGTRRFNSPEHGGDWVLVLDDTEHGFPPPGHQG